jgi:hypothetical protein
MNEVTIIRLEGILDRLKRGDIVDLQLVRFKGGLRWIPHVDDGSGDQADLSLTQSFYKSHFQNGTWTIEDLDKELTFLALKFETIYSEKEFGIHYKLVVS